MSKIENNIIEFNSKSNIVIDEIKEKLKNLTKKLEEPEFKYKDHCNFLREQVDTISKNAINEINDSKKKFFQEIDVYEIKCRHIAEEEQLKKWYIQELIDKSNEKLVEWQINMKNADNVEKSLVNLSLDESRDN